jgi:hypothetical protein
MSATLETQLSVSAPATTPASAAGRLTARFAGFVNFTVKDAREWLRTRRALWTALAAQALVLLGVMGVRIYAWIQPSAQGLDWSPSGNMTTAGWDLLVPLFAIFLTMGTLVSERENRTLPWSLSMPLTRLSVFASKLITSVVAIGLLTIVLPLITAIAAVRIVYGDFPSDSAVLWPVLQGASVGLFCIVLNLFSGVIFKSQKGVVGIALICVLIVPGLIQVFWSTALPWWPLTMDSWVELWGKAEPRNWITPVVYVASMVALLLIAQIRFSRDEM